MLTRYWITNCAVQVGLMVYSDSLLERFKLHLHPFRASGQRLLLPTVAGGADIEMARPWPEPREREPSAAVGDRLSGGAAPHRSLSVEPGQIDLRPRKRISVRVDDPPLQDGLAPIEYRQLCRRLLRSSQ